MKACPLYPFCPNRLKVLAQELPIENLAVGEVDIGFSPAIVTRLILIGGDSLNTIMESYYPVFRLYQSLRDQMMTMIEDKDLNFQISENNPSLGVLCREIGEVQHSYIESFRTLRMDFSFRLEQPDLDQSVQRLTVWYAALDQELEDVVSNLSQDEIDNRKVDRGGDFLLSPQIQLDVYKEALLIFYGKASVYMKALDKDLPDQWRQWIA